MVLFFVNLWPRTREETGEMLFFLRTMLGIREIRGERRRYQEEKENKRKEYSCQLIARIIRRGFFSEFSKIDRYLTETLHLLFLNH